MIIPDRITSSSLSLIWAPSWKIIPYSIFVIVQRLGVKFLFCLSFLVFTVFSTVLFIQNFRFFLFFFCSRSVRNAVKRHPNWNLNFQEVINADISSVSPSSQEMNILQQYPLSLSYFFFFLIFFSNVTTFLFISPSLCLTPHSHEISFFFRLKQRPRRVIVYGRVQGSFPPLRLPRSTSFYNQVSTSSISVYRWFPPHVIAAMCMHRTKENHKPWFVIVLCTNKAVLSRDWKPPVLLTFFWHLRCGLVCPALLNASDFSYYPAVFKWLSKNQYQSNYSTNHNRSKQRVYP